MGDILKHLLHVQLLNHLNNQSYPVIYLESHSGPGLFKLADSSLAKYHNGIGKLWKNKNDPNITFPPCLQSYIEQIEALNTPSKSNQKLTLYPGSPALAQTILNNNARLKLFELQTGIFDHLVKNTHHDNRVECFNTCGFNGVLEQEFDSNHTIFLLIDPPYEQAEEYQQATTTLFNFHQQYPKATIALWYPVINRHQVKHLEQQLKLSGISACDLFEIDTDTTQEDTMTGAGMVIINSPKHLLSEMQDSLPLLVKLLSSDETVDNTEKTIKGMSRCVRLNNLD